MKKTLAVVLSAVMVSGLALSGCGGNSTSATTAAPKETTTAAPAETKKGRDEEGRDERGSRIGRTGDDHHEQLAGGGGSHFRYFQRASE